MTLVTGLPIDRRDGRLKVTGRAKYAAEFDIDNVAHAVLVQSTISSGSDRRLRPRRGAGRAGRAGDPDPAERAAAAAGLLAGSEPARGNIVAIPLLQDDQVYYNGQHIAVVVADTLERAQYAASLVKIAYHRGRSGDPHRRGARPGLSAQALPQRRAPARQQPRRPRRRLGRGADPARPDLYARRSSTTIRWSRMRRSRCGKASG